MPKFEYSFFEYLNALSRYMKIQPLNLGGYHSWSGGIGGPPGGFIGYLPQTRVAYDASELAASGLPDSTSYSGASLLDNLNHIRYRLDDLETNFFGVTVMDDTVIIGSGITILNFENSDVEYIAPNQVNITLHAEQADKFVPSGIYGEDLSFQIGSSGGEHFFVANQIYNNSLRVYYNGIRQSPTYHTLDNNHYGFTTTYTVASGDAVVADYEILINDITRVAISGVTQAFLEANYYDKTDVDAFIAAKSDVGHTHVEADITDLIHDADYLQGIPIASGAPLDGQALVYNVGTNLYEPTDISSSIKTVNQQFIFTVEGVMSNAGTGVKPYRIYSHEVNGTATIDEIFASLNIPPDTDPIYINILKNGVSIFDPPEYMEISVGDYTGVRNSSFASDTFEKNDYFKIELVQTDEVASDLTVHIRFHWETD